MMAAMLLSMGFVSCSDDDEPDGPGTEETDKDYHFDLWVALDRHGGMGRDVQTLVRSVNSLDNPKDTIGFTGTGTEVNAILTLETICKGAYYYQVPVSGDRFSKYTIADNHINVVQEQRFKTNTFSARKYDYAWLGDNTLLIMAASGDAKSVIWTKLNSDDMTIIAEGTLDLPLPEGAQTFTTSGVCAYREHDNKLFYFYYGKSGGTRGKRTSPFHIAVINPKTMTVESDVVNSMADEMVGTAYGQLLQKMTFTDESGNLYLVCFKSNTDVHGSESSHLLRINAGQTNFDPNYDGFSNPGKLMAVEYLGGSKCLAYARDDEAGTSIDSYAHYYTVIDLRTCANQRLSYNGKEIDYSGGRFSSRMAYTHGAAYIGVNTENADPCIYIYDVASGNVAKGASIREGFFFEQIRVLDNVEE